MRIKSGFTVALLVMLLAGCKESREDLVQRLYPVAEGAEKTVDARYQTYAPLYPHVSEEKAKQVIAQRLSENATYAGMLEQIYSEEYFTDAEVEVIARIAEDRSNAASIAGGEENLSRLSQKYKEAVLRLNQQNPTYLEASRKENADIRSDLSKLEADTRS